MTEQPPEQPDPREPALTQEEQEGDEATDPREPALTQEQQEE